MSEVNLDAFWMPYTANREFKAKPRMIVGAEGAYYVTSDQRRVFDGLSGLWTTGAGHNRPEIADAVARQLRTLDYAPAFQFGHPLAFELAERVVSLAPEGLDHAFFVNSGSECTDTATKIARAYWRVSGQSSKTKIIGRAKGYHGASWGAISFGGIPGNRKLWGQGVDSDHLGHTLIAGNEFTRGQPQFGEELADELEQVIGLHDASNVAAVIVEPISGSAGVIVPPVGYLKRLREICDRHQVLLIFDEVITAFGRIGNWFAASEFGVTPDLLNVAKQLTNGAIPLGAVLVTGEIYDAFMAAGGPEYAIELPHGYTYSGHPVACAAAMASLDILEQEGLIDRVREMTPGFESRIHELKGAPHVTDIRNFGFAAGLTLAPYPEEPLRRPFEVAMHCWRNGYYVRYGGDTIQLGLPFITEEAEIDALVNAIGEALTEN
ncbi:MAG: aspartate aminotransferase family protein [Proteobacteria bacterium]|jgi:beta-alanine--pyruvate transaminase|nr:aspartate aminotransferase family protein [Pseudomonadota bacterium]MDA1301142.1 aspartate aminotransferase family protein [Pseudomonadota bacterium]